MSLNRTGYLSLGSNLGDRSSNLQQAITALIAHGLELGPVSAAYETEPVGPVTDQPDFLNACVEFVSPLDPEPLLAVCKAVEREVGRAGDARKNHPRLIDVDLLLLGDLVFQTDVVQLPHPELSRRRFVVEPLLEIAPNLLLPDGRALLSVHSKLTGERVQRHSALAVPDFV